MRGGSSSYDNNIVVLHDERIRKAVVGDNISTVSEKSSERRSRFYFDLLALIVIRKKVTEQTSHKRNI